MRNLRTSFRGDLYMLRRYFFLIAVLPLMGLMAWVSSQTGGLSGAHRGEFSSLPAAVSYHPQIRARQQLVELLDRLVFQQHYVKTLEGRFTSDLGRLSSNFPLSILAGYDLRVEEANRERFKITARILNGSTEQGTESRDFISIDEAFRVTANFPLPPPRATYLREHALRHLRAIQEAPPGQIPADQGVYSGYFRYEISAEDRSGYGLGVRAPVLGVRLDLQGQGDDLAGIQAVEANDQAEIPLMDALRSREPASTGGDSLSGDSGQELQIEPILPERE